MDIRPLTETYAVSPQITGDDIPAIKAAGYTLVICNRPDAEIPPPLRADEMRAAVEAAGLVFVDNPVVPGQLSAENIEIQRRTLDAATGPVLAYCASGNRSSIVWALANAGRVPSDELIGAAARHGYQLAPFRGMIEQLAQG